MQPIFPPTLIRGMIRTATSRDLKEDEKEGGEVQGHGCKARRKGSTGPPIKLREPQVGFPEEEGKELQVVPGVGGGPSIEHTYGGGVGGKHLLLGKEGVLPSPHSGSDMFVRLTDLGVQPFNLLVRA